jgi:short-subunit dehydrogenase
MQKTILVCGYGPGISESVAKKFGSRGYLVGLVARNGARLDAGVKKLGELGVTAKAFPCDLGDPAAVAKLVGDVRSALGPIGIIHYNAYAGTAGDLLTASAAELRTIFDVGVTGCVVAVQNALPDLKEQRGAVLITGGGFSTYDPSVDAMIVQYGAMGLSLAKAAQHKLAGILGKRLAPENVYVGEVVVLGLVKGTAFDSGQATLDPDEIADRFVQLEQERSETSVHFG